MANNRLIALCNVCQPDDEGWNFGDRGVMGMAKWYPSGGSYYNFPPTKTIENFFIEHSHPELPSEAYTVGAGQDNPIRFVYESVSLPIISTDK